MSLLSRPNSPSPSVLHYEILSLTALLVCISSSKSFPGATPLCSSDPGGSAGKHWPPWVYTCPTANPQSHQHIMVYKTAPAVRKILAYAHRWIQDAHWSTWYWHQSHLSLAILEIPSQSVWTFPLWNQGSLGRYLLVGVLESVSKLADRSHTIALWEQNTAWLLYHSWLSAMRWKVAISVDMPTCIFQWAS